VQAWLSHPITRDPDSPLSPYRKEILSNLNAAVALSLMQTLDEIIAARRARVRAYQDLLGAHEHLELIAHQPGSACLSQIVHVLPGRRGSDLAAHLVEALRSAGYEIQGSYVPIHLVDCYQTWVRQRLPYAERLWSDLIELPCEPDVSFAEVERIAGIVRRVLKSAVFLTGIPVNLPKDKSALRPEAGL
jgi:dTDP-4-amino-4,6-dideoxygalactose transaminase